MIPNARHRKGPLLDRRAPGLQMNIGDRNKRARRRGALRFYLIIDFFGRPPLPQANDAQLRAEVRSEARQYQRVLTPEASWRGLFAQIHGIPKLKNKHIGMRLGFYEGLDFRFRKRKELVLERVVRKYPTFEAAMARASQQRHCLADIITLRLCGGHSPMAAPLDRGIRTMLRDAIADEQYLHGCSRGLLRGAP